MGSTIYKCTKINKVIQKMEKKKLYLYKTMEEVGNSRLDKKSFTLLV